MYIPLFLVAILVSRAGTIKFPRSHAGLVLDNDDIETRSISRSDSDLVPLQSTSGSTPVSTNGVSDLLIDGSHLQPRAQGQKQPKHGSGAGAGAGAGSKKEGSGQPKSKPQARGTNPVNGLPAPNRNPTPKFIRNHPSHPITSLPPIARHKQPLANGAGLSIVPIKKLPSHVPIAPGHSKYPGINNPLVHPNRPILDPSAKANEPSTGPHAGSRGQGVIGAHSTKNPNHCAPGGCHFTKSKGT